MSQKQSKTKSNQKLKELFGDSDEDIESINVKNDSYINYATDFNKWTVHHYYAMKNREKYPNMFFYYFPRRLLQIGKIDEKDNSNIIDYIFRTDEKKINGKWGYLSLLLEKNPNISGEQLFNLLSNIRTIVNFSNSYPLKEDAAPDFDDAIKQKVHSILDSKRIFYDQVLSEFETYLKEEADESKRKKYYNFLKNYEEKYIYCDQSKNMPIFLNTVIEIDKHNNNNNDIILILPENYNEINNKNISEEEKNSDSYYNSDENKSKKKNKGKRKLINKKKMFKIDFDLDSLDESNDLYSDEEYNADKINSKSKKIILDEDNDEDSIKPGDNIVPNLKEIRLEINRENKSKKNKKSKHQKRDISYKSEIIYSDNNNKENQIKNNFDILNTDIKPPSSSIKNPNINYSTNLSTNFNLLSSKSNLENIISQNKEKLEKNNNEKIINNKNINDNKDIEFYQNEQILNGYASDFTKKIYYQREIKNKVLVFSDNEDEIYLKKKTHRKKQKITRIKANEPIIIREKDKNKIKNYNDFVVIGMESAYIDKNIEKLKRGLMHKKMQIRKRKNKNKRNKLINELKKKYKEEDFSDKKYKGDYKKVIREVKNLEKKKIYKVNDDNINHEEKLRNIRSKKGNYYEIASQKNFNMDMDLDVIIDINNKINNDEFKNERKFFNCFANKEKEVINFSDTDSFLSLFSNPKNEGNKRKNRNNNKKLRLKDFYDNSRNQNINTFFPKISKDNFIKDRQTVISIRKLIDNEKYGELFDLIKKDINLDSRIPQHISDIYNKIFNYSNDIDIEKLNEYKTNNGYLIKINNNYNNKNNQEDINTFEEKKLLINNEFDIENLIPLFGAYLEKLQISLSFLLAESKYDNNIGLRYKKEEINKFKELNVVENLLKLIIININKTPSSDFNQYFFTNMNINNLSSNEYLKNEFSEYYTKIKNIFNDSFTNILNEIYITFLRFFISYKTKDIKFMDVEDFCFMSYTFLQIMQALFQKIKELENITSKLNNGIFINTIPNTNIIHEITNKYMKCLCLFLLNHLYIYSNRDYIPLAIKNIKKEATYDKSSTPQESLILVTLFKSISSLFFEINPDNNIDNSKIKIEDDSFRMLDNIFKEYLNNGIEIDTSNLGPLNELLIKELRFYLSPNLNNCLSKEKKNLSILRNIKKVFLYNCFDIDNLFTNDSCIKKMINSKIIVNLIQRYLFVIISYFIYYGKNIDCLKYFNEFYNKYNNATDDRNQNNSYFDVDYIKEIIDKNNELNLKKLVKCYLVEEYIYSDVELMNFYDQFWHIDFDCKSLFIKNYFNIMCNHKYRSRYIDNIFKKNEILSLIDCIFEFKAQNNDNISKYQNNNDISQDEYMQENENNRDDILQSFESVLIKTIYMISESINKTLITLESNNNEDKVKKNLSKIITISNIFIKNISQLNNNNYTLFIIPMISTILIFTQHLLKFKEIKNIEITINKIKDILESSGLLLKSFSLSLWINIIQKLSEKNINFQLDNYIGMVNIIIRQIIGEYHEPQERKFSMKRYIDPNYDNRNEIHQNEYFEIIYNYLVNIKNFAEKNPNLLIKNCSILNEIYNILNIKYYYSPEMRTKLIDIINILITHINKVEQQMNTIISEENNNYDDDVKMLKDLNDNMINSIFNVDEFYNFLQEEILPNVKYILDIFISTENTNVANKKKILYPLYEENALLYANIFGILLKNGKKDNHLEYPSYVFNLYYNKDYEKNNIFDNVFKSSYTRINNIGKECYIKLPFRLLNIYLDYYNNIIDEIINDNYFNIIIKYYLELFFIGIFINNKNNKSNLPKYEIKYCEKIFKNIKMNKELLTSTKEKIKTEFHLKTFISEENKNKISLINIMIVLADIDNTKNIIGSNEFALSVIGELLAKLSLDFNMDQIDSETFFELINGQKTKIALNKINKLSISQNNYNQSQIFNENEINIRLSILGKYKERYIKSELNNKFASYIDDFIKELSGEQLLSSIITLNFINSLLIDEKKISSIPKKFETCLNKIYNFLILKSSNLCNILSFKDLEKGTKDNFNNSEINDLISRYYKRNQNLTYLRNNIHLLDFSFYLKENIINKFITELPLDASVSSNFFTNLLKYISNNRNSNSYDKTINNYYEEAIYYYISLSNILDKEVKINKIIDSIVSLYNSIENNNEKNINFIGDLKSFYVFIFFLEKINCLITVVMKIEDIENYSKDISSFLDENHLSSEFLLKTINVIECFCSFMYQYIIQTIKSLPLNNRYVHTFILKKMKLIINKSSTYFTNRNIDDTNNFMNEYLKVKFGKDIMIRGYKLIEKITNNIRIYARNDSEIIKKIDFIKYINFDGVQYFINNTKYKS